MLWWLVSGTVFLLGGFLWLVSDKAHDDSESVAGKHVVITGGSSGIGLATAKLLAREGASVTIMARDQKKLDDAVKEISAERKNPSQKVTFSVQLISNLIVVAHPFWMCWILLSTRARRIHHRSILLSCTLESLDSTLLLRCWRIR